MRFPAQADEEPERDADRHAGGRADREPRHAILEVLRQDALVDEVAEGADHIGGGWEESAREETPGGGGPPQRDERGEGKERAERRPAPRRPWVEEAPPEGRG